MARRPDLLEGLSRRQRRAQELKDLLTLKNAKGSTFASRETFEKDFELVGLGSLKLLDNIKELTPETKLDFAACARVDLDNPIYFKDNMFCDCYDCDCRLQYRPNVLLPQDIVRLCISCAARRLREEEEQKT